MRSCAKILLASICVAALPGCQSLFASHGQVAQASLAEADMQGYFEQRLAVGRAHLLANRPAAAVTAFRQASYGAAVRARALNGMAIAYDRLGRADLAQRYFMAAMNLEPENPSFAANFLRFNQSLANAPQVDAVAAAQAQAMLVGTAEGELSGGDARPDVAAAADRIQRVSPSEVRIAAAPEAASEPEAGQADRVAARAHSPALRARAQNREYPVRVELGARRQPANAAAPGVRVEGRETAANANRRERITFSAGPRSYPVRVYIDQS